MEENKKEDMTNSTVGENEKNEDITVEVEEATVESNETETNSDTEANPKIDFQNLIVEFENKYKRLQADFENFKRRTNQEKTQLATFLKADIIEDFLPVLDNFDRALTTPVTEENKALYDGLVMVQQALTKMLEKHGLVQIDALGKPFDPNVHQAVMRAPSDEYEDDTVMEVLQPGYMVDGKIVRPAMVKVVSN